MLYNMMRPMFNERVRDSIIFQQDLACLHMFVDPIILPEELGGTCGKFDNTEPTFAVKQMSSYFAKLKDYAAHVNQ